MFRSNTTRSKVEVSESSLLLPYHNTAVVSSIEQQQQQRQQQLHVPSSNITIAAAIAHTKRNVLTSKILAILGAIGLISWIGISSLSSSSSSSSSFFTGGGGSGAGLASSLSTEDARNHDDTILYRWEEFLHGQIISQRQLPVPHHHDLRQQDEEDVDSLPITASTTTTTATTATTSKEEEEKDDVDDMSRNMKSESKKEFHTQKKLDKKDRKINSKTVSAVTKQQQQQQQQGEKRVYTVVTSDDPNLIYLNTTKAYRYLRHDVESLSNDFFRYIQGGWEVQVNQAYCAVATSAAVLNSYRNANIVLPQDAMYDPYRFATQTSIVQDMCVQLAVIDVDVVSKVGLGIHMVPGLLNCILQAQGYEAISYPMDVSSSSTHTIDTMRDLLKKALMDDQSRVLVNYDRGGIGQGPFGHGHWSPIGAYNPTIDSFLIMDVAKYKYPPVFVPTHQLYHGVSTLDSCAAMMPSTTTGPIDWSSGQFDVIVRQLGCQPGYRGFVIIQPISNE
jgi:hypothetical protein